MDLQGFDANQIEPNDAFDPLPYGDYLCVITHSEEKPTRAGIGSYLELEFEVVDGAYQGRKLWDRLNLKNPSDVAVKIAQATLSAICRAVGVERPRDSCELHDLPLICKVRIEQRTDTDESTNTIKGYKPRPQSAAAPSAEKPGPPPWKRTSQPAATATSDAPF